MNKREEIENLQEKIKSLQTQMSYCKHIWKYAKYDPKTVREPFGFKHEGHGSDVFLVADGYRNVSKPRWSRECKECGKIEYSYTEEVVSVEKKPKFNS
jgi:hypothetical protein